MSGLTGCHSKYKSSPKLMIWHTHMFSCMHTHTHSVTDRKMDIKGLSFIWRWCISSLVSIAIDGCQATAECVAQGLKGPSFLLRRTCLQGRPPLLSCSNTHIHLLELVFWSCFICYCPIFSELSSAAESPLIKRGEC